MKRSIFASSLLLAACAGASWAAIGSCPTSSAAAAAGTPPAGALSTFGAQSPTNGCFQVDKNFDNFNVTTSGNTGSTGDPTTGNVEIFGTGGVISGSGVNSTITPILAHFQSTNFSDGTQWVATGGTQTLTSSLDFQAAVNGNSPPTPDHWVITSIGLSLGTFTSANPGNAGNTIDVKKEFCLGQATFNCTSTSTDYGFIEEHILLNTSGAATITDTVCNNNGATSCTTTSGLTLSGLAGFSTIGIQETVTIHRIGGAGTDIFLDSFADSFGETAVSPEPSTFVLLGSALAAAGLLRLRSRRKVKATTIVL